MGKSAKMIALGLDWEMGLSPPGEIVLQGAAIVDEEISCTTWLVLIVHPHGRRPFRARSLSQPSYRAPFQMSPEAKDRVVRRVTRSGALPVSRDAPGYAAVLRLLGVDGSGEDGGEKEPALNGEAARAGGNARTGWSLCFPKFMHVFLLNQTEVLPRLQGPVCASLSLLHHTARHAAPVAQKKEKNRPKTGT